MARPRNLSKSMKNLQPNPQNVGIKYKVSDIIEEIKDNVDERDFVNILQYLMTQPYSKVKYMVEKCADLPIFVKNVASAFLNDTKNGKTFTIQSILNRVYGLPKSVSSVSVTESDKPLMIEFVNKEDEKALNEFLKNEGDISIRKDTEILE